MKDDFESIVISQLEDNESILKILYSSNVKIVIITNNRIFIHNIDSETNLISYKFYLKSDFKEIYLDKYVDNRSSSLLNFYYLGSFLTIIILSGVMLSSKLKKINTGISELFILFISFALPTLLVLLSYKLFKKFVNTKLVATIILNDGKEINIILDNKSTLELFKS